MADSSDWDKIMGCGRNGGPKENPDEGFPDFWNQEKMTLNVLYVGQLSEGGTCLARAQTLEEYGWKLHKFDITSYYAKNRILRGIEHRLLFGPNVIKFNHDLLKRVSMIKDIDVVWIDKGRWVFKSTIEKIKKRHKVSLVHYTPDPAFRVHNSHHFHRSLPIYDLCITNKRYELIEYKKRGAKEIIFTFQGIDDRFINCGKCNDYKNRQTDIIFIGHAERYYAEVLSAVIKKNAGLAIYGMGWECMKKKYPGLRPAIKGGPVWGNDYVLKLANAKIGVGLLSKYCPDQFTTRSFEIPGAGAMLIAERTEEHQEIFQEGKEAVFFSELEELNDKIDYYLHHDSERIRIAERGREKVLACYHWRNLLSHSIKYIESSIGIMK